MYSKGMLITTEWNTSKAQAQLVNSAQLAQSSLQRESTQALSPSGDKRASTGKDQSVIITILAE